MRTLIIALCCFLSSQALGSESCKARAEELVEFRSDYKNYGEVEAEAISSRGTLSVLRSAGANTASSELNIKRKLLLGQLVFVHYSGLKGDRLYKKSFNDCVAQEKSETERASRQAAREEARKARDASKGTESEGK